MVPDVAVVVDYMEVLEFAELQGVILTQTTCQAVQHSKGRRYSTFHRESYKLFAARPDVAGLLHILPQASPATFSVSPQTVTSLPKARTGSVGVELITSKALLTKLLRVPAATRTSSPTQMAAFDKLDEPWK